MTKVAVLGCGPAGLLAAHAVHEAGEQVTIYSIKKPSPIGGAQYLHRAIPGLTTDRPDGLVNFLHIGEEKIYAAKVYGDPNAETSWGEYQDGLHEIWNMHAVYNKAWSRYEHMIIDVAVRWDDLQRIQEQYDLILSAVPLKGLCYKNHRFASQDVWITHSASFPGSVENLIIYNGATNTEWYRSSRIFGHGGTEWPEKPEGQSSVKITKPLYTNCDCWSGMYRLGRYGAWKKKLLIHDAYEAAQFALEGQDALF